MILNDLVPGGALTAFTREVPTPANYILDGFLPNKTVQDIEATIDSVTRTNRAASFRSYDAETPIGQRDAFSRRRVMLPPVGQKTVVGELERLQLERIRNGGGSLASIAEQVYDDADINARAVLARVELARGDVLEDGKFTLTDENGLTLEADFGVDADNLVAPTDLWSDHANATPISDLTEWVEQYTEVNGIAPGYIIMSRTARAHMLQCAEVKASAFPGVTTPPNLAPGQLAGVLETFDLPPITIYDTRIEVGGVASRVISQDKVIFGPEDRASLGETVWGITAEALELAGLPNPELTYEQLPGLVGVVMRTFDPVHTWTKVGGVVMPVIYDPARLLVADVL
ncbi:major capsid protein [Brachybacterium sp. DNPG3]